MHDALGVSPENMQTIIIICNRVHNIRIVLIHKYYSHVILILCTEKFIFGEVTVTITQFLPL